MAKKSLKQIASEYDQQLIRRQKASAKRIEGLFDKLITDVSVIAAGQTMPSGVFSLSKLPLVNDYVNQFISRLNKELQIEVVNGITGAWDIANVKNNLFADIRLDASLIPMNKRVIFYDTNAPALEAYKIRKINGLGISDRIYQSGTQLKAELEAGIGLGISKGQSSAKMSADLRQYLKDPNKLFRRVRDAEGELQLSDNAKAFHPGQGVYRSSFKNINRLNRTEINMAYRNADMLRYAKTPFIIGYEVRLSAQHPKFDICDFMAGQYPTTFVFIGWHPQCLCFTVPILMNEKQFAEYQQLVLKGLDTPEAVANIVPRISSIPEGAEKWIQDNKEKVAGWSKPPLWWKQNNDFVPDLSKINPE